MPARVTVSRFVTVARRYRGVIRHPVLPLVDLVIRSLYHVKWVDSRGYVVEALVIGNQPWLRVHRGHEYVAYYADVTEMSEYVDLADLMVAD